MLARRSNVHLNLAAQDKYTAFGLAIHKRSWPIARPLAAAGARLDDNRLDDNTWLRKGVGRPDAELVRHMLDYGSRVDVIALQAAAYFGDPSIVEILIVAGADVNVETGYPSPLFLTTQQRHLNAARVLIKHRASARRRTRSWTRCCQGMPRSASSLRSQFVTWFQLVPAWSTR